MFTGIVQGPRPIVHVADHVGGRRLVIDLGDGRRDDAGSFADEPLALGESIAVDGVCLTVASTDGLRAGFDVISETLSRSTLGRKRIGDRVNVERALRPSDRLGGHFVQGHVDGLAALAERQQSPRQVKLVFRADARLLDEMLPKGSIAISGVSLTLVDVDRPAGTFSVALIPTTLAMTTLADLSPGEPVNIETDLIGKWVRRYLAEIVGPAGGESAGRSGGGLTLEALREAGFA